MLRIIPILALLASLTAAALEVTSEPLVVFAAPGQKITLALHNNSARDFSGTLHHRLFQISSATVMPAGKSLEWKRVTVPAGYTVLETADVDIPVVRVPSRFQLRWSAETEETIGKSDLAAIPEHYLAALTNFCGDRPIGLFDPGSRFASLFREWSVPFEEVDAGTIKAWKGNLLLIGPTKENDRAASELLNRLQSSARPTICALWLVEGSPFGLPSFSQNLQGRVMAIHSPQVTNISSAALHLQLVRMAELSFRAQTNLISTQGTP